MPNFDEKPEFIHENRRFEEAHDKAEEAVAAYWLARYSSSPKKEMYIQCKNGDLIYCEEAQTIFNTAYGVVLETEMHV